MEITYKRELKHNYLIITPEEAFYDSYEIRMLAANCIEGLLKFHVKQVDNRKSYYYEITSRQPLTRILEYQSLGAEQLRCLITGIVRTLERMETYLLQEGQILLEPEYIYVEPEYFSVYLCLIPGRQGGFPEEMTALLQYLLGKGNHQDKECVVMAYGLYQESLKENYGMADLLRLTGLDQAADRRSRQGEEWSTEENNWPDVEMEERGGDEVLRPVSRRKMETRSEPEWKEHGKIVSENKKILQAGNEKREERRMKKKTLFQNILTLCTILAGGPVLCWLLYGGRGVKHYWPILAGVDVLTALFLAVRTIAFGLHEENPEERHFFEREHKNRDRYGDTEKRHEWQMVFQEEPETNCDIPVSGNQEVKIRNEECNTVLLTEQEQPANARCFRSLEPGVPDIIISYVPFLIGKQEGLADYVLSRDTVSRLHAKIDREGEEYRITDLNSTNGTMVGGRLLETNETAPLLPGEEVYIANVGFIFT